ncbi:MAG: hypothetical protein HKN85_10455 [Gammaproteobacteria bacterium]|nr:hypothetical protein [Gammaproteobacteria bacterium]
MVVPLEDDFVVVPLQDNSDPGPGEPAPLPDGVILFDALTDGTSSGQVSGGAFGPRGWTHFSGGDKIFYDLGQTMEAGIVEFELTGISPATRGGYLQPGWERAYYFGLFNNPSGNKGRGGGNPAFIEIRYNWGNNYANLSAVKFQVGDRGLFNCCHGEEFGTKPWRDWNPIQYYRHKVVFGDGSAALFIDDAFQVQINYTNRPLGWRYLFVGAVNYVVGAPDNVTYRNVKVTKIK